MRRVELRRRLRRAALKRRPVRNWTVLLLAAALLIACLTAARFVPVVMELALSAATDDITIAVNQTVAELMSDGGFDCSELVRLEKDVNGNITALSTDITGINMLQSRITAAVVERFLSSDVTQVSVPIGNLAGGALLSGRGPRINVKLLSVSNVRASFRNEFSSAGINQTRHRILMDVEVDFGILLAGRSRWETVRTEVSVAETVIVGTVPGTYAELGR